MTRFQKTLWNWSCGVIAVTLFVLTVIQCFNLIVSALQKIMGQS